MEESAQSNDPNGPFARENDPHDENQQVGAMAGGGNAELLRPTNHLFPVGLSTAPRPHDLPSFVPSLTAHRVPPFEASSHPSRVLNPPTTHLDKGATEHKSAFHPVIPSVLRQHREFPPSSTPGPVYDPWNRSQQTALNFPVSASSATERRQMEQWEREYPQQEAGYWYENQRRQLERTERERRVYEESQRKYEQEREIERQRFLAAEMQRRELQRLEMVREWEAQRLRALDREMQRRELQRLEMQKLEMERWEIERQRLEIERQRQEMERQKMEIEMLRQQEAQRLRADTEMVNREIMREQELQHLLQLWMNKYPTNFH